MFVNTGIYSKYEFASLNFSGLADLVYRDGNVAKVLRRDHFGAPHHDVEFSFGDPEDEIYFPKITRRDIADVVIRKGNSFYLIPGNELWRTQHTFMFRYGDPVDVVHFADIRGTGKDDVIVQRGNQFYVLWNEHIGNSGIHDFYFCYGDGTTEAEYLFAPLFSDAKSDVIVRRGNMYLVLRADQIGKTGHHTDEFSFGDVADTVFFAPLSSRQRWDVVVRKANKFFALRNEHLGRGVHDDEWSYGDGDAEGDGLALLNTVLGDSIIAAVSAIRSRRGIPRDDTRENRQRIVAGSQEPNGEWAKVMGIVKDCGMRVAAGCSAGFAIGERFFGPVGGLIGCVIGAGLTYKDSDTCKRAANEIGEKTRNVFGRDALPDRPKPERPESVHGRSRIRGEG